MASRLFQTLVIAFLFNLWAGLAIAGELLQTPDENDDWARIGWSMAYVMDCNKNYGDWRSTKDRIVKMYESGVIKEHQYTTYKQMRGRTAGAVPRGCSMKKMQKRLKTSTVTLVG